MLFRLNDGLSELEPVAFGDFAGHSRREKHLEGLLSRHLFGTLFEARRCCPSTRSGTTSPKATATPWTTEAT